MKLKLPKPQGVALVIVLVFLALLAVLIIAFLTTVDTETEVSTRSQAGTRSRELVETVNSLVIGQVREATTQGQTVAWASQPGMIRTFGKADGSPGSAPLRYYKLYSAQNMIWHYGQGTFQPLKDVPADWSANEALFTDLNRPIYGINGVKRYPIVQPPSTNQKNLPVGLKINPSPGGNASPESNAAPMPVRWLYVLRDGKLTAPATGGEGGKTVKWAVGQPNSPTPNNPIVGRVAFWTDDETSKINVNTAAGDHWNPDMPLEAGSYWDLPRTGSQFEKLSLAQFQPARQEYQRYPGHPATTYLSAAFPNLTRGQVNQIAPRIQTGGSLGGTGMANGSLATDADRLYAYEDELIFNDLRASSVIDPEELEQARFVLTAHSRAPEVNLLNQPRIACWPIHRQAGQAYRSAFDRLIAFCSRIGGQNYFFDRENADSATADFAGRNVQLYEYLKNVTAAKLPGYDSDFLTKYGPDRDQILTEMFDYIRTTNLFDDSIEAQPVVYPTSGQQFTDARTGPTGAQPGHGQVTPIRIGETQGFGRFNTISEIGMHFICTADASIPASNIVPQDNADPKVPAKPVNRTLGSGKAAVKLKAGERRIEAMLLLEAFSPSLGWPSIRPDMQLRIRGLEKLSVNGISLGMPSEGVLKEDTNGGWHTRRWGGAAGFRMFLNNRRLPARGVMPADGGHNASNSYPFVSVPITVVVPKNGAMSFSGGKITIEIFADSLPVVSQYEALAQQTPVQTIQVNLAGGTFPVPNLVLAGTQVAATSSDPQSMTTEREFWWTFSRGGALAGFPTIKMVPEVTASTLLEQPAGRLHRVHADPGNRSTLRSGAFIYSHSANPSDVVRTMVLSHGDYRLLAATAVVPESYFVKHRYYDQMGKRYAHSFHEAASAGFTPGSDDKEGQLVSGAAYDGSRMPDIPVNAVALAEANGDWDTGLATITDGAYINKPDEGNSFRGTVNGVVGTGIPYFDGNHVQETGGPSFFSPNRQIPSPVMFGSLPNQVKAGKPWSTLRFRPKLNETSISSTTPPDHLLLDLFWMPVVEPYAISEPLSTAGKINLNSQIVPFTFIERTTALRALLRSERVLAIPTADANIYKKANDQNYRHAIDADETLKQMKMHFDAGNIYRSPSEVCNLHLVPQNVKLEEMKTFWETNKLTGDNARERPYATLYPRLTTKSNTYRVHYRVQALRQASRLRGDDAEAWAEWDESSDSVTAESRGSTIIERYIDPSDPALPDFAATGGSLDSHYRYRILGSTKFGPQ